MNTGKDNAMENIEKLLNMNCTRKSGQWKFKLFNRKKEVQKMAKRQIQFTHEQIEILLKNPNVESISSL